MHGFWNFTALFVSLTLLPILMNAQDKTTFTDSRDGHVYHWVKTGTQAWMTENLKFNAPAGSWAYNSDSANEENFGRLYSWKAAQSACPKGWHVPSEKEWGAMRESLGSDAGLKIQSMDTIGKSHVKAGKPNPAAASTLLSGVRHPDGSFTGLNSWGGCWTSGKVNDTVATNILFAKGSKDVGFSTNDKTAGFSVRCVRNK